MKNIKPLVPIILILIGLGVGFFGGYEYRNYRLNRTVANFGGSGSFQRFTAGRNGQNGNGAMRGGVIGNIVSMDDKSITVKMNDGSTKIVFLSSSTAYSNTVSASSSDLKTGENVAVFGSPNSDGSVTATSIQLNPQFFRNQVSPTPKAQ